MENNIVYLDKETCKNKMLHAISCIATLSTWEDAPEEQIEFWFNYWCGQWQYYAGEYKRLLELEKELSGLNPDS